MTQPIPTPEKRTRARRLLWLAVTFLAGAGSGVAFDRLALTPTATMVLPDEPDGRADDSAVTRENFVKIAPGMSVWDVTDILGTGRVVSEEGYAVEPSGQFKKWQRGGGISKEETGKVSRPDGRASRQVKRELCWTAGRRAIYVTFVNDRVESKRESGLY
jgi:hypothetical protein